MASRSNMDLKQELEPCDRKNDNIHSRFKIPMEYDKKKIVKNTPVLTSTIKTTTKNKVLEK